MGGSHGWVSTSPSLAASIGGRYFVGLVSSMALQMAAMVVAFSLPGVPWLGGVATSSLHAGCRRGFVLGSGFLDGPGVVSQGSLGSCFPLVVPVDGAASATLCLLAAFVALHTTESVRACAAIRV